LRKRKCIQDDFWSMVAITDNSDECWNWKGAKGARGYGNVRWNGKVEYAHRIAYMLTHNDLGDLCVLHRCDNRLCCNPNHHFKGTYADNNLDKKNKGRAQGFPGEQNPAAVLDWTKVREIRGLYDRGYGQTQLARQFGVTQAMVWLIVHNKKWIDTK
jgi:hypothetical protein